MGSKMPVIYVQNAGIHVDNSVAYTGSGIGSSCRKRRHSISARQQVK